MWFEGLLLRTLVLVTLAMFHAPTGWLKAAALLNMIQVVVTWPMFHASTGWSKEDAL